MKLTDIEQAELKMIVSNPIGLAAFNGQVCNLCSENKIMNDVGVEAMTKFLLKSKSMIRGANDGKESE